MKKVFKSFNLNHAYKSIYSVGSYNTFTSYMEYMNGFGFINDVTTGNPVPSCMYDVSTVSINESFSPLFGIDMTFRNNLTAKVEMRKSRVLTLSMTSQQLTETRSNDFVVGFGYKIADLNLFAPKKTVRSRSKGTGKEKKTTTNASRLHFPQSECAQPQHTNRTHASHQWQQGRTGILLGRLCAEQISHPYSILRPTNEQALAHIKFLPRHHTRLWRKHQVHSQQII